MISKRELRLYFLFQLKTTALCFFWDFQLSVWEELEIYPWIFFCVPEPSRQNRDYANSISAGKTDNLFSDKSALHAALAARSERFARL